MNEQDIDRILAKHAARYAESFLEMRFGVGDRFLFETEELSLSIINRKDLGETTKDSWLWRIDVKGEFEDEAGFVNGSDEPVETPDIALCEAWEKLVDALRGEDAIVNDWSPMRAAGILANAFRDLPGDRAKTIADNLIGDYSYLTEHAAHLASSFCCFTSPAWNENHSRFRFIVGGIRVEVFRDSDAERWGWTITGAKSGREHRRHKEWRRHKEPQSPTCTAGYTEAWRHAIFDAWAAFVELTTGYRNLEHFLEEAFNVAEFRGLRP